MELYNIGLFFFIICVFCGYLFYKLIQHFNYELHFKEAIILPLSLFIILLVNALEIFEKFNLYKLFAESIFGLLIVLYFFILMLIYYITRTIKLKKYIPSEVITSSIIVAIICIFTMLGIQPFEMWDDLAFIFFYILAWIIYIGLLIIFNLMVFIINALKMVDDDYKNEKYKISISSFICIFIIILLSFLLFYRF